jgi:hypothetical protein
MEQSAQQGQVFVPRSAARVGPSVAAERLQSARKPSLELDLESVRHAKDASEVPVVGSSSPGIAGLPILELAWVLVPDRERDVPPYQLEFQARLPITPAEEIVHKDGPLAFG